MEEIKKEITVGYKRFDGEVLTVLMSVLNIRNLV